MAVPIGFAEVTGRLTLVGDNQEMNVVFGIEVDTPPMTQTRVDGLSTDLGTFLKGTTAPQYTYVGCRVAVGSDGGEIMFESTTGAGPGTQGAVPSPQNVASLFRKSTAVAGKRNRGRMYVPGVPENLVGDAGVLTAATVTDWNTKAATFLANLITAGHEMHLLHPARPVPPPKPPPVAIPEAPPTPVTSLVVQPLVATQRRRLR